MRRIFFTGFSYFQKEYVFASFAALLCLAFIATLSTTSSVATESPASSVELGFTSLSPAGSLGGEIIPASCASGYVPHPARGDVSCNMFVLSVDAASVPYNGSTTIRWSINPNYNGLWGTITGCQAEGNWSGAKSTGGGAEGTGALTPGNSTKTYTLRCQATMTDDGLTTEDVRTVYVSVGAAPVGCAYGTDGAGNALTNVSPSNPAIVPGGRYKASAFGNYCFGNSGGASYYAPLATWPEFYSFWSAIPGLSGLYYIP